MKVKGYLTYRNSIGEQDLPIGDQDRLTLRQLLEKLAQTSGLGDLLFSASRDHPDSSRVIVLINGRHHTQLPDGLDTLLSRDDEVAIFPPLAGG